MQYSLGHCEGCDAVVYLDGVPDGVALVGYMVVRAPLWDVVGQQIGRSVALIVYDDHSIYNLYPKIIQL